jgi:hypothetical protein
MHRLMRVVGLGILGIALIVGVGISGDTKKDKDKDPGKKPGIPSGWKALKLSKDQHDKVVTIAVDYDKKISALQSQIDDLKSQRRAEQVKVLTDAQKAILLKGLTGDDKDKKDSADKKDFKDKDK